MCIPLNPDSDSCNICADPNQRLSLARMILPCFCSFIQNNSWSIKDTLIFSLNQTTQRILVKIRRRTVLLRYVIQCFMIQNTSPNLLTTASYCWTMINIILNSSFEYLQHKTSKDIEQVWSSWFIPHFLYECQKFLIQRPQDKFRML